MPQVTISIYFNMGLVAEKIVAVDARLSVLARKLRHSLKNSTEQAWSHETSKEHTTCQVLGAKGTGWDELNFLATHTKDPSWLNLEPRWESIPLDLKWLCLTTGNKFWLLYKSLYLKAPLDLRYVSILMNEPLWLHNYLTWNLTPWNKRLRSILERDPGIARIFQHAPSFADVADELHACVPDLNMIHPQEPTQHGTVCCMDSYPPLVDPPFSSFSLTKDSLPNTYPSPLNMKPLWSKLKKTPLVVLAFIHGVPPQVKQDECPIWPKKVFQEEQHKDPSPAMHLKKPHHDFKPYEMKGAKPLSGKTDSGGMQKESPPTDTLGKTAMKPKSLLLAKPLARSSGDTHHDEREDTTNSPLVANNETPNKTKPLPRAVDNTMGSSKFSSPLGMKPVKAIPSPTVSASCDPQGSTPLEIRYLGTTINIPQDRALSVLSSSSSSSSSSSLSSSLLENSHVTWTPHNTTSSAISLTSSSSVASLKQSEQELPQPSAKKSPKRLPKQPEQELSQPSAKKSPKRLPKQPEQEPPKRIVKEMLSPAKATLPSRTLSEMASNSLEQFSAAPLKTLRSLLTSDPVKGAQEDTEKFVRSFSSHLKHPVKQSSSSEATTPLHSSVPSPPQTSLGLSNETKTHSKHTSALPEFLKASPQPLPEGQPTTIQSPSSRMIRPPKPPNVALMKKPVAFSQGTKSPSHSMTLQRKASLTPSVVSNDVHPDPPVKSFVETPSSETLVKETKVVSSLPSSFSPEKKATDDPSSEVTHSPSSLPKKNLMKLVPKKIPLKH